MQIEGLVSVAGISFLPQLAVMSQSDLPICRCRLHVLQLTNELRRKKLDFSFLIPKVPVNNTIEFKSFVNSLTSLVRLNNLPLLHN